MNNEKEKRKQALIAALILNYDELPFEINITNTSLFGTCPINCSKIDSEEYATYLNWDCFDEKIKLMQKGGNR